MKLFKKTKDNKLGWKVYFIIFLFGYIDIYFLTGFSIDLSIKFFVHLILNILGIVAFFCFAWDKKLFNKLFWQIAFVSGIMWKIGSITIFFATSYNLWNFLIHSDLILITTATVLYVIFPLAGLYYYAFRNDVWNHKNL